MDVPPGDPLRYISFHAYHAGYGCWGTVDAPISLDPLGMHENWFDTLLEAERERGQRENGYDVSPAQYVDEAGYIWLRIQGGQGTKEKWLYTDFVEIEIEVSSHISITNNPFGQAFRAFDDGDAGAVSFERLDHTGGDFSTPIQPFGAGSNSPSIECLPDGRLRAALIDGDGLLQQYQSYDDGETWGVV